MTYFLLYVYPVVYFLAVTEYFSVHRPRIF